jgi:hypothetical protein
LTDAYLANPDDPFAVIPVEHDPFAPIEPIPDLPERTKSYLDEARQLARSARSAGVPGIYDALSGAGPRFPDWPPSSPGLPPPQPTPPSIAAMMENQRRWGMPPASEQIPGIITKTARMMAAPVIDLARKAHTATTGEGADKPPEEPLSDDPQEWDAYYDALKRYHGGNLLDLLGLTGARAPVAKPGELGIFGGRLAKTADLAKLAEAQGMEKAGSAPSTIWYHTGWAKGRDGEWRFEIPDYNATWIRQPKNNQADTMEDIVSHPELFAAYPDMADTWAESFRKNAGFAGEYVSAGSRYPRDLIRLRNENENPLSVALHELQHGVQEREGFGAGANYDRVGWDPYIRTSGEVEARNVQKRADMIPEALQYTPPWLTEDRPRTDQLVRDAQGRLTQEAPGVWDTKTVSSGLPLYDKNQVVIQVDPKAVIAAHKATDPNFAQYDKVNRLEDFVAQGNPLSMPEIGVTNGRLGFTNGRNRTWWAANRNLDSIPVVVDAGNKDEVRNLLGQYGDKKSILALLDDY